MNLFFLLVVFGFATSSAMAAQRVIESDLTDHYYCGPPHSDATFRRMKLEPRGTSAKFVAYSSTGVRQGLGSINSQWSFDAQSQKFGAYEVPGYPRLERVFLSDDKAYLVIGTGVWHVCDRETEIHATDATLAPESIMYPALGITRITKSDTRLVGMYWCGKTVDGVFPRRHFSRDGTLEVVRYNSAKVEVPPHISLPWSFGSLAGSVETSQNGGTFRFTASISADGKTAYLDGVKHVLCNDGPVQYLQ